MKSTCKTCPLWKSVGEQTLVEPSAIAGNNGKRHTGEVGLCMFKRPEIMLMQKQGPIQGSVAVEQQRVYPPMLSEEGCADHPDFQQEQWGLKVAIALRLWAGRLEYDPDRHHTKTGFSRPPTLQEAKDLAANKDQLTGENKS